MNQNKTMIKCILTKRCEIKKDKVVPALFYTDVP